MWNYSDAVILWHISNMNNEHIFRLEIQDVNVQKPNISRSYDQNSLKMCDNNDDDDDNGHMYDGLIIPKRCT